MVLDLPEQWKNAFSQVYEQLRVEGLKYLLATYFGALEDNLAIATQLPVDGLDVDLVRAPEQLESVVAALPSDKILSAVVIKRDLTEGKDAVAAELDANKQANITRQQSTPIHKHEVK